MRLNEPVTNVEYILPDGEVIITHTDTSSRITYANAAFLRSSGFSLEECLGSRRIWCATQICRARLLRIYGARSKLVRHGPDW